ncbi:hypothetical protein KY290_024872 [Solanum tuberosum]|uniref:Uncharacterized protein n=1 Tax=Solanum tuberosum TaxID=4113 RepID=A0ABQ7URW9_SOLTU|nr:hypothetical protein KY290_024872 [Solanum tuberosum]
MALGYDGPRDNEQHGCENYNSEDYNEMNGVYDSCGDGEGREGLYVVNHCEDEGLYTSHYDYDGDVRYTTFSHRYYEFFQRNLDENGSCEIEFPSSSFSTVMPCNF